MFRELDSLRIHNTKLVDRRDFVSLGFVFFDPNGIAIISQFYFRRLFAAVDRLHSKVVYQLVAGMFPIHLEIVAILIGAEHFFYLSSLRNIGGVDRTFQGLFAVISSASRAHTFQFYLVVLLAGVKLKGKIGIFTLCIVDDLFNIYRNVIGGTGTELLIGLQPQCIGVFPGQFAFHIG